MARHRRRLILWLLAGVGTLALLVLLAFAALWFWLDPNDYRAQIETRASAAIGRPVQLTGTLRWQLGRQVYIVSDGGQVANAEGFGPLPLASWARIRIGVAAWPLLKKRVQVDRLEIEGLDLQLQRNTRGATNWTLQLAGSGEPSAQPVTVQVGSVQLRDGRVRYQDAATGADWQVTGLAVTADLPEDLTAATLQFRDVDMAARVAGGPLAAEGVVVALQADQVDYSPSRLQLPAFSLAWADATIEGHADVQTTTGAPAATATLAMQAPSLRALLATVGVSPPAMTDPTTLGALQWRAQLRYALGAASVDLLSLQLDDTTLSGELSLPQVDPLAVRFALDADTVNLDRYLEPPEVQGDPLELPLAQLRALDVQGTLRIRQATVAGAVALDVVIDVE